MASNWYIKASDLNQYLGQEEREKLKELESRLLYWIDIFNDLVDQEKARSGDFEFENKLKEAKNKIHEYDVAITKIEEVAKQRERERIADFENFEKKHKKDFNRFLRTPNLGEKMEAAVKKFFGTTYNLTLAGYILRDGELIPLSYHGISRDIDHRQIGEAFENCPELSEFPGGTEGMKIFMDKTGAGRLIVGKNYISIHFLRKPTLRQAVVLWNETKNIKEIDIDISGVMKHFDLPEDLDGFAKVIGYGG